MNIAIILDPLDSIKTYKDSTFAMMREAARRGHQLHVLMQADVVLKQGQILGFAQPFALTGRLDDWYEASKAEERPLNSFDAVLLRKDPPFDMEYLYSTQLLELAEAQGARVFNKPSAVRDFNEKLAIARFPEFTAPTLVTRHGYLIKDFLSEHGDIILKPLDAMGGASIFRVHKEDRNINVIIETMTALGNKSVMAQRYIPEIAQGDKRILLINGEPVPYALARIPMPGETRGNLAAGGTGVAQPLSARDLEIAQTLGPQLRDLGLFLVGLDVIGDYLTEVNVTSPTGFQEIMAQTDCDVAGMFIDALENACHM
jgi:glutathione synthase